MGASNHTTNYNLSQFVGTDKPAWLQDYNGDMSKIDAGIHQAKQAADTAQLDATQAGNAAAANASAITSLQTNVGSLQTAVGTNTGNINTINSLIGNGTPTTTDQTLIGAINELVTNMYTRIKTFSKVEVSGDGVKTVAQLLEEIETSVAAIRAGLTVHEKIILTYFKDQYLGINCANSVIDPDNTSFVGFGNYIKSDLTSFALFKVSLSSHEYTNVGINNTPAFTSSDHSSDVIPSGLKMSLGYVIVTDNT